MTPYTQVQGLVLPMDRANVDTDAIIPKQFLKSVKRSGFGPNLFDAWRYTDPGEPGVDCSTRPLNPNFVLNQARYKGASVLLARRNFGCGSSREHAVWALEDAGFRTVIAPSFADIFFNNCFKNGVLAVALEEDIVEKLFREVAATVGYSVHVDLQSCTLTTPSGDIVAFEVDSFRRRCLLEGLDEIGLTLQHADEIRDYERRRRGQTPWLFGEGST
jgi:3-isopropylmalate/(R)-2-methylmalate dehydratase small subunit